MPEAFDPRRDTIWTMDAAALDTLADDFFSAITQGNLERVATLYEPDLEIWHNVTRRTQSREENLKLLEVFTSRVKSLRYEVHAREFFPGGFVQRHTLHGSLASGEALAVPVCIVIHAAGGRIQRLYEYLDAAAVASAFAS